MAALAVLPEVAVSARIDAIRQTNDAESGLCEIEWLCRYAKALERLLDGPGWGVLHEDAVREARRLKEVHVEWDGPNQRYVEVHDRRRSA